MNDPKNFFAKIFVFYSESFNSCEKHVFTIFDFFSSVSAPDIVIFRPKNEISEFGHFIEFGVLTWLDIA